MGRGCPRRDEKIISNFGRIKLQPRKGPFALKFGEKNFFLPRGMKI